MLQGIIPDPMCLNLKSGIPTNYENYVSIYIELRFRFVMKGMRVNFIYLLLVGFILNTSCGLNMNGNSILDDEPGDLNGQMDCEQMIISESKYNSAIIDEFIIQNAFISNDSLMILVQYGGGCGITDFDLLTNGLFMESDPVQLDILLSFIDDDPCEAAIQRMLCFDLSNLIALYNDSYQTTGGTIILRLEDYDDNIEFDF